MKSVSDFVVELLVSTLVDPIVAQQAEDEAMREVIEAVTAAAERVNWAIEGKRVLLSRQVRERIAARVADGELPGDLAYKAFSAGWPAEVASAVARYGRRVAESVAEGHGVNKYWGDVATA